MNTWKLNLKKDPLKEKGTIFQTLSERIDAYWDYYMKDSSVQPDGNTISSGTGFAENDADYFGSAASDIRKTSAVFSTLLCLYGTNSVECSFSRKGMRKIKRPLPWQGHYHTHDYIEILYVAKGSFDQILLGEPRHFSAGECVISDCNLEHADLLSGDSDSAVLFLWLQRKYLDQLLSDYDKNDLLQQFFFRALKRQTKQQNYLHLAPDPQGNPHFLSSSAGDLQFRIETVLETLVHEDYRMEPGFEHIIYGSLIRLFSLLCANYSIQLHSSCQDTKEEVLLFELERYMRLYPAEVSVEELAKVFHYHRNYYNLLFKKHRGTSFQKHLINIRMEQAACLLKDTKLSIKDVAQKVGYTNTSHFYHLFEKTYGCTPKEWRLSL